jgi:hypothetical protein
MPWLATTTEGLGPGLAGVIGKFWWFKPDSNVTNEFHEVLLPSDMVGLDQPVSWASYQGLAYAVGGWTDNAVFTGDFKPWSLGIEPPTVVPTVALGAGPGITAEVICYLRFLDIDTGERSPLSAPSATLSAVNQSIDWTNLVAVTSPNPRVTHVEGWRSVDGSLPRFVWSREIGVTSVNDAVAVGAMGEAFTEDYDKFPRCRYNVIWHERQVMAGNDEHPDTIYFSLIGYPERRSTITLRTKSGHPVIGLLVVRDTLIVLCRAASEIVSGFTEDDIQIQIAQPRIGALSHWATQVIHGLAFIWADLGLYLCDGSSWFYMGEDVQTTYAQDYLAHRTQYESAVATHDPVMNVVMLIVQSDVSVRPTVWVADYNVVLPQQGGNFTQPNWSFDHYDVGYDPSEKFGSCAAVLAVPGGHRGDTYFGSTAGRIYRYCQTTFDEANVTLHDCEIVHGADAYADQGGDSNHGKRFSEIDVFMTAERNSWRLNVLGGDEWILEQEKIGDDAETHQDFQFQADVPASLAYSGGIQYEKRTVHHFKIPSVTGRRCVVRMSIPMVFGSSNGAFEYNGYQLFWMPGPTFRKFLDEEV